MLLWIESIGIRLQLDNIIGCLVCKLHWFWYRRYRQSAKFQKRQQVPVESSFLLNQSNYLWFICFPWWSIDELENLHADRTTVCFEPWWKLRARFGYRKTGLSPQVFLYWPFQGSNSVVVPYCYLFLLSVFILWFSYYVSDIFCKF